MDYQAGKSGNLNIWGAVGHKIELSDRMMAEDASKLLADHYPGHKWLVSVNSEGGVMDIKNLVVSGDYGYRIIKPWLMTSNALNKEIMKAGGEILERADLARGRMRQDTKVEFVDGMKIQHQPAIIRATKYMRLSDG